jgi:RNA polymerase sigma-70 factor (ECF subfamily)
LSLGRRSRYRINAETLDALYREHAPDLLVYFARRLLDPSVAVDLVAETFLAAYAGRRSFRGKTSQEAVAWLYGIAQNLFLGHLRASQSHKNALARYRIERRPLGEDEIERVEELASLTDLRAAVRRALPLLSEDHQIVLDMRVIRQLEYDEIATRLCVTEDAARARVSRGLRALAAHIEHER